MAGAHYLDAYLAFGSEENNQESSSENQNGNGLDQASEEDSEYPIINVGFLHRHAQSNNVSERQVAVRHIIKTLQNVQGDGDGESEVFELISLSQPGDGRRDFATDQDPLIRAELVEQFPLLCMHCYQTGNLVHRINDLIVPLLVKFLSDQNVQVRKTCQAAILILLEQDLLGSDVLQADICPVLLGQAELDGFSDDIRIEAVGLLCKIVTGAFDRDQAVSLFLAKFTALCSDPLFHIRKVCASTLGDLSRLLGPELTERVLVPHLVSLSQDSVWGVRKACAEVFTEVSYNCCMATRRNHLAPIFTHLLQDASRWVQSSTFQALGPFISTFADSTRTGLKWVDGELVYEDPTTAESSLRRINSAKIEAELVAAKDNLEVPEDVVVPPISPPPIQKQPSDEDVMVGLNDLLDGLPLTSDTLNISSGSSEGKDGNSRASESSSSDPEDFNGTRVPKLQLRPEENDSLGESSTEEEGNTAHKSGESTEKKEEEFSSFFFWRTLPFDEKGLADSPEETPSNTNAGGKSAVFDDFMRKRLDPLTSPERREKDSSSAVEDRFGKETTQSRQNLVKNAMERKDEEDSDDDEPLIIDFKGRANRGSEMDLQEKNFDYQDIIPQALLDNFLSMVEPSRAQTVESDISRHCAYNLPAVALTMGRQHWPLILPTYNALANDMQWKVRRTLAFSLHELAAIVGPEVAVRDLLPVFTSFLRDLDEVRIGVLKHLYQFLKVCTLLSKDVRKQLLQHLADFMQTDNTRNWRFRLLLAEQLISLCELYDADDVNEYLSPIGMTLGTDKVADIRLKAHKLLATIVKHFFDAETRQGCSTMALTNSFIVDIIKGFGHSQRFMRRQSFAYICGEVQAMQAVSEGYFASKFLPVYLEQAEDPIANVRIAFARSLCLEFFNNDVILDKLHSVLKRMSQNDSDKDAVILARQLLGVQCSMNFDSETNLVAESTSSSDQTSTEC